MVGKGEVTGMCGLDVCIVGKSNDWTMRVWFDIDESMCVTGIEVMIRGPAISFRYRKSYYIRWGISYSATMITK